ncbi:MAG: hypothetical protein U9O89_02450 [Thermoproteota archaeon]|nr:hypothetical protein [Thermoproteota archaeon]
MRKVEWNRKTISVVLLAVVLPVSLTVAFQLFGRGTKIAENTTLEPVQWSFQRPNQYVSIGDLLNASYADDGLSATFHMILADYLPRVGSLHYDTVRIRIKTNATTDLNGYIESVNVLFQEERSASRVSLQETDFDFQNLSLVDKAEGINGASMRLDGVNNPSKVALSAVALWKLLTLNTQSHQMEVAYEIVYYNGTAYNRVVQPFQLNILGAEE